MMIQISKKKIIAFLMMLIIVTCTIFYFSTPWKSTLAPDYAPLTGIHINMETDCSNFTREIGLRVYDGTDQVYECKKPTLEYQFNDKWYKLKTPLSLWGGTSSRGIMLYPEETTTIHMNLKPYGYFLKNGHYRIVISSTGMNEEVIAVTEFDIKG